MVDKKIWDINFRHSIAKGIANKLDQTDETGKDGYIIANVWNDFVSDKNGKQIKTAIGINNAIKSISTYLYREALKTNEEITNIGDKWEASICNPEEKIDKKVTKDKKTNKKTETLKVDTTNSTKAQRADNADNANKAKNSKNNTIDAELNSVEAKKGNIYAVDNRYSKITKKKANELVKKDPRLEKLSGGSGWSVKNETFRTDVKYARKYTGKILSYIANITGIDLIVTSALGTGQHGNPHKKNGYASHHNAENPKLDLTAKNCSLKQLQARLISTGFFSRVSREKTHLDVQIKPEVYLAFEQSLSGPEVTQLIKEKKNKPFLA